MITTIDVDEDLKLVVEDRGGVCRLGWYDDDGEANIHLGRDEVTRLIERLSDILPRLS